MQITKQNYEFFALDYIEGTLPAEDRMAFERFLAEHPAIAQQVRALQAELPRLSPDRSVCFEGKVSLKRKAPVRMLYVRIASAAAMLLAGVLVFNALRTDKAVEPPVAPLIADAVPAPVPTAIDRQPEGVVAPLVGAEPPSRRLPALPSPQPQRAVRPQIVERQPVLPDEARPVEQERPVLAPITAGVALKTFDQVRRPVIERVVSVTQQYVVEHTNEPVLLAENRNEPPAEMNSIGFLNLLSRRGFRNFASRVIAPLSEISPISIHENNEERVIEFASIPISRRNKRQIENQ